MENPTNQPPTTEITPDILTQDQKRYLKEISNAQTRIATLVTELKDKKVADKSTKEARLEESIELGYNAVNAILAEFGLNPIETPTLQMVQAGDYKVESMYKSILEIELPQTLEAVEENDENSDSSETPKPPSPAQRLEAIKKALTGKVEKPKGGFPGGKFGMTVAGLSVAVGVTVLGNGALRNLSQFQETGQKAAEMKSGNETQAQQNVKNFVNSGMLKTSNIEELQKLFPAQTLNSKLTEMSYSYVKLTPDQVKTLLQALQIIDTSQLSNPTSSESQKLYLSPLKLDLTDKSDLPVTP